MCFVVVFVQPMELYASISACMKEIWRTWPKVRGCFQDQKETKETEKKTSVAGDINYHQKLFLF